MKNLNTKLNFILGLCPRWTLYGFWLISVTFFLLGCQDINELIVPKAQIEQRTDIDTLVEYEYRIDNVSAQPFTISDEDSISIYLFEVGLYSSLTTTSAHYTKTIINKFTESSEYYDYADFKDVLFAREEDKIIDSLAFLAIKYNLDSIIEADESIPNWWFNLEESVFDGILQQSDPRGLMSQLNDNWRN